MFNFQGTSTNFASVFVRNITLHGRSTTSNIHFLPDWQNCNSDISVPKFYTAGVVPLMKSLQSYSKKTVDFWGNWLLESAGTE
jgi:hypothetical protein